MYVCGTCRQEVDPADPNVIPLRQWMRTRSFGETDQWVEGMGQYFHKQHAPRTGLEWRTPSEPPSAS
jgi:hypothetical protein